MDDKISFQLRLRIINMDTSTACVTILASDFSYNRAGSSGGTINNRNSNKHLFIDYTCFFNTSANCRVAYKTLLFVQKCLQLVD